MYRVKGDTTRTAQALGEIEKIAARAIQEKPILEGPGSCCHEDIVAEVGFAILMKGGDAIRDWRPGQASAVFTPPKTPKDTLDQERISKMCDAVFSQYDFYAWRGP